MNSGDIVMVFHAVLQSARLVVLPSVVKIIDRNVTEMYVFGMMSPLSSDIYLDIAYTERTEPY